MKSQKIQYTSRQISNSLDVLVFKIGRLALCIEILSPYLKGRSINDKHFILPQSLILILDSALRYYYGQLYRYYFDTQGRENNTASINVLKEQLFKDGLDGTNKNDNYSEQLKEITSKLQYAETFKNELKQFSHKHFAHTDINKSLSETQKELATIGIPWQEFTNLINNAKIILTEMCLICEKPKPDFSESTYSDLKNEFWESIKYEMINVRRDKQT